MALGILFPKRANCIHMSYYDYYYYYYYVSYWYFLLIKHSALRPASTATANLLREAK